ncbi:cytochrome c-type biogenesis protein [Alisedimentitalea sp. MJ-SS2]|uniref:cytochrome c-type biogenesis protein n=1 Tax=Aliisedimentitalea sp. MJ-SS2 TaxID=3049795 RepID=UPI0029067DF7|nr:cytochrome c-type biogenesis protein [Alisedimentitalea sp. MJ-SS2]MDU8929746.1 cytochrome c-type biogenesis protein [Alisedimentitalea sp. MJ-SS2]
MKRLILILMVLASPVWAVEPDEMLDDPALEARAREISKGLRCLVCRNENIDDSNADLARDLRIEVRERLLAGDSNEETMSFLVDRYGEYVLLKPTASGSNKVLYLAGPVMMVIAALGGVLYLRRRSRIPARGEEALSVDEAKRLDEIMKG